MKTKEIKTFDLTDLGCANSLLTEGFSLIRLDRTNPKKVKFVFKKEKNIEKVAEDYWSDNLRQNSRSFWDNAKNIKSRLYQNNL